MQRKNWDTSKIKSQGLCENEYRKYCLNGGDCYYLVDEDIVGCNCTWLFGRKRCEDVKSICAGTRLKYKVEINEKLSI